MGEIFVEYLIYSWSLSIGVLSPVGPLGALLVWHVMFICWAFQAATCVVARALKETSNYNYFLALFCLVIVGSLVSGLGGFWVLIVLAFSGF